MEMIPPDNSHVIPVLGILTGLLEFLHCTGFSCEKSLIFTLSKENLWSWQMGLLGAVFQFCNLTKNNCKTLQDWNINSVTNFMFMFILISLSSFQSLERSHLFFLKSLTLLLLPPVTCVVAPQCLPNLQSLYNAVILNSIGGGCSALDVKPSSASLCVTCERMSRHL